MSIFPVAVGTALFFLVMVICGIYILVRHRAWRTRWTRVEARVVRLEGARVGEPVRGKRAWPVVEYLDTDGRPHEVRLASRVPVKSTSSGDPITVFYRPDRPYAPRPDSAGEVFAAWLSFAMAGASVLWLIAMIVAR